jgi:hypothetical protein
MPTFGQVPQSQVQPTNVSGNIWNAYNAQVANSNNFMNGLFGLAGDAAMAFSDKRLKRNLKHIGRRHGLPLYEFSYRGLKGRFIGILAQHLAKVRPDAVMRHASGFLMVAPEFAPVRVG